VQAEQTDELEAPAGAPAGASRAVSPVSQRQVAEWPRAKWSYGLGAVTAAAGSATHGVRQATARATRAGPHCTPLHGSGPEGAGGRVGRGAGGGLAGAGWCGRAGPVVTTQPRHARARSESPATSITHSAVASARIVAAFYPSVSRLCLSLSRDQPAVHLWRWSRIRQGTASRPRPTTATPLLHRVYSLFDHW
jgi:hypothetical protein